MKDINDLGTTLENGLDMWQKQILKKGLNIIGQNALADIKALTPVDTGLLRRRWNASIEADIEDMKVKLSNNTEYAPAINYGKRVTKNKKTVGKTKGAYMLEKGINNYKNRALHSDIDKMLNELKDSL